MSDAVWTYAEACAAGFTEGAIQARVRSGRWRRLWRGVYVDGDTALSASLLARAALAITGEGLVAASHTAAALHGFDVVPDGCTHLVGGAGVDHAPRNGLRVHVAERGIGRLDMVDGVPCTTADRTAIDLARRLRRLDAIAVLDAALRTGTCTHESLRRELLAHRGLRGVVQARQLLPLADANAESPMESRLRLRILDGSLPRPELQWLVLDGVHQRHRLDLSWPDRMVAAEYDGAPAHLQHEQLRRDRERHNWLTAVRGWRVLYFTDADVYRRPGRIIDLLSRELRRAA